MDLTNLSYEALHRYFTRLSQSGYMKYTNVGSYTVAQKNGMKLVEEYEDPVNTISKAYAITREEWEKLSRLS